MSGQGIAQFIPLILIFVIFTFLIRPQQKRVKDHKAMVESLKERRSNYIWWNHWCC